MTKISVIIPVYNQCSFITEAIDSVLGQTCKEFEIIVVDDGSTDEIQRSLESYMKSIQYIYKKNQGTASALNKGIRYSHGDWICWLSADDMFMPNKLSRQIELVRRNSKVGLVYTSFYDVDVQGNILKEWFSGDCGTKADWAKWLLKFCFINGSTVMLKKDLLYHVGLFDESLPYAHDYDLWLRLLPYCEFSFCPEPLVKYRKHNGSLTERLEKEVHKNELLHIRQRAYKLFRERGVIC